MATGPDHYREAEKNLHLAEQEPGGSDLEHYHLAAAQVHAALALAAATALSTDPWGGGSRQEWLDAAGPRPSGPDTKVDDEDDAEDDADEGPF